MQCEVNVEKSKLNKSILKNLFSNWFKDIYLNLTLEYDLIMKNYKKIKTNEFFF